MSINVVDKPKINQVNQFNAQLDYNRQQWNAANEQAVINSNVNWRRQSNMANTAAQNAVNQQNAQNAFGLTSSALSFLWQELRDQADFDFRAYENENYKEAENNFKFILESKTDYNLEFYYAMALLNQNKIKSSDSILNILKNKTHDFVPEVYWYSALIAVSQEDFKNAKKDLKALQDINSNFKKEELKTLLEDLD